MSKVDISEGAFKLQGTSTNCTILMFCCPATRLRNGQSHHILQYYELGATQQFRHLYVLLAYWAKDVFWWAKDVFRRF